MANYFFIFIFHSNIFLYVVLKKYNFLLFTGKIYFFNMYNLSYVVFKMSRAEFGPQAVVCPSLF